MFRKAKKPAISFDRWCGDAEAPQLRAALEQGDTGPLERAYARADPQRREFLIDVLTVELPAVAAVTAWPDEAPKSALAYLTRGSQRISSAWEARGGGYAETVGKTAWDVFFELLTEAEADLSKARKLEDDGVASSRLLISGRGLERSIKGLRTRYTQATAKGRPLAFAADQLLQALCAKWGGSHEAMFEFARSTSDACGEGDPRHRLIAIAHFERGVDFRGDTEGRNHYRADSAVHAELIAAAEKSVFLPGFGSTPQEVITLNCFAVALSYFRRHERARPLLERIGTAPTIFPWSYFGDNTAAVFADYRAQAGVKR